MKILDITGKRFGRLVAIRRVKRWRLGSHWLCRCDCGKEATIYLGNLKTNTKSCGCYRSEAASKWQQELKVKSGRNPKLDTKFSYYKRNAKVREVPWKLTRGDFEEILKEPCHYCGTGHHIGIDRVDSLLGYDYSNVVACCTWCNQAKNDRSTEEFADWVERIHSQLQLGKWKV